MMTADTTQGASLAPCPFCGSADTAVHQSMRLIWIASCNHCEAQGPVSRRQDLAVAAWNRRAQAPAPQGPSDAIVTKVAEFNVQPSLSVRLMERVQAMPVGTVVRLYATPQPPAALVPLTNAQIASAWRQWPRTSVTSAARAIEFMRFCGIPGAAHGIGKSEA